MKTLSQKAYLSSFILMLISVSLTLMALSSVLHQQNTKSLFQHLKAQLQPQGSVSSQELVELVKQAKHIDKRFKVLSLAMYISPAQNLNLELIPRNTRKRLVKNLALTKYSSTKYYSSLLIGKALQHTQDSVVLMRPLAESFMQSKANETMIHALNTQVWDVGEKVYELSLPLDPQALIGNMPISQQKPRWLIRFSKSSVLDTLVTLSSEQSHILTIEALILILFSFYLISKILITPLLKLTHFAKALQDDEDSIPPLSLASSELLALQQSLIDSHQALREDQRVLASLYQKLAEHERQVTSQGLSAKVMHEIGNPLASVMGLIEYLKTEASSDKHRELLDLAYTELTRIKTLSKQLLKTYRPSNSKAELHVLCDWVRMILKYHNEYSNIELSITGVTHAHLDIPLATLQVSLLNLLMNAARAQKGEGQIRIHCSVNTDILNPLSLEQDLDPDQQQDLIQRLNIYVLDQGKDVLEEIKDMLFEPWQSTEKSGHGLGLAITRSSLEQYGSTVNYLSKQDRKAHLESAFDLVRLDLFNGACFYLSIPLAAYPSETAIH